MNSKQILRVIGEIDESYIEEAAPMEAIHSKKKSLSPALVRLGAAAACLCLIVVSAFAVLLNMNRNTVQTWTPGYTGGQYFRYSDSSVWQAADSMACLDSAAIPYAMTRYFSDKRSTLEADGVIPVIDTHPLFSLTARYKEDGSLFYVELLWSRRGVRGVDGYSDLRVIAGVEAVPLIDDCVLVETDENGKVKEPGVTATNRGGTLISARGGEKTEKSLTYQRENGWYQVSGSWNDSYDNVVRLLDWFFEHPIDFSLFPMDAGDEYTLSSLADVPAAFSGILPDFASFGFLEEVDYVTLKNGVPVRFEGHYAAHVDEALIKGGNYYEEDGYSSIHWCVLAEPDVYDLERSLGDIQTLTREQVTEILLNKDNKITFLQGEYLIIVYPGYKNPENIDEAWELIASLKER
ncbi:MAG: hypothetical protein MJ175_01885 [Clostridia bacterium]|nr:hypothetical protein [Clostridia bacterium]